MKSVILLIVAAIGLVVLSQSVYVLYETEQVIITKFGELVGDPIDKAGIHFKTPFLHSVNRLEKRTLEWDGRPIEMPTKDKTYIIVDTFARWRINNAMLFFKRLRDERSAQSRLEDILGSETRNAIAKYQLIEVVRTDQREIAKSSDTSVGTLYPIQFGHSKIENEIKQNASGKLEEFGIILLDIRFKRVNYNATVQQRIYERMISERQQIADRFRSEGAGEAAKIRGKKEKDLQTIASKAYLKVQTIKGKADAKAAEIYARAYNQSPQAIKFYAFLKSLESYKKVLNKETQLILSTDNELFHWLSDRQKP